MTKRERQEAAAILDRLAHALTAPRDPDAGVTAPARFVAGLQGAAAALRTPDPPRTRQH